MWPKNIGEIKGRGERRGKFEERGREKRKSSHSLFTPNGHSCFPLAEPPVTGPGGSVSQARATNPGSPPALLPHSPAPESGGRNVSARCRQTPTNLDIQPSSMWGPQNLFSRFHNPIDTWKSSKSTVIQLPPNSSRMGQFSLSLSPLLVKSPSVAPQRQGRHSGTPDFLFQVCVYMCARAWLHIHVCICVLCIFICMLMCIFMFVFVCVWCETWPRALHQSIHSPPSLTAADSLYARSRGQNVAASALSFYVKVLRSPRSLAHCLAVVQVFCNLVATRIQEGAEATMMRTMSSKGPFLHHGGLAGPHSPQCGKKVCKGSFVRTVVKNHKRVNDPVT